MLATETFNGQDRRQWEEVNKSALHEKENRPIAGRLDEWTKDASSRMGAGPGNYHLLYAAVGQVLAGKDLFGS